MTQAQDWQVITRRGFVLASGTVGAALLAACGSNSAGSGSHSAGSGSNGAGSGPSGTGGQGGAGGAGGQGGAAGGQGGQAGQGGAGGGSANVGAPGSTVIALRDVPVDGATSAQTPNGDPLIVAQPTKGQVVAFSAICTHMGCTVAPEGGELLCPCHGSVYDPFTGKNLSGPAPRPLDKVNVRLNGSQVVLG